jgi:hypothetical protein
MPIGWDRVAGTVLAAGPDDRDQAARAGVPGGRA